jgi:hypothetical protein
MRYREIITEAKNTIFADTKPFDQVSVTPLMKAAVDKILAPLGTEVYAIGSSANPKPGKESGDFDVQVDEAAVAKFFKVKDGKAARQALDDYIQKQGFEVKKTGITVHVRIPLKTGNHQADIEVVADAANIHQLHRHDIPPNSPFKGVNKQQLLSKLAKDRMLMYSAWQGLFHRDASGNKGDFITNQPDQIAKEILGANATGRDLGSVESILKHIPNPDALLNQMRLDPNWQELHR